MTAKPAPKLDSAGLEVLSERDCWELLATGGVGRIGIIRRGVPEILPISYRVVDHDILFRTGLGSRLSAALLGSSVAFEVDRLGGEGEASWSVQMLATTQVREVDPVADAALLEGLLDWAPRPGPYLVRLRPRRVTGRRSRAAPVPARTGGGG